MFTAQPILLQLFYFIHFGIVGFFKIEILHVWKALLNGILTLHSLSMILILEIVMTLNSVIVF